MDIPQPGAPASNLSLTGAEVGIRLLCCNTPTHLFPSISDCSVVGCWDVGCCLFFCVFPSISILALAVVGCISLFRVPLAVMSCFLNQRYEASTKLRLLPCEIRLCDIKHKGFRIFMFGDWNWQDLTRLFQKYQKVLQLHLNHEYLVKPEAE